MKHALIVFAALVFMSSCTASGQASNNEQYNRDENGSVSFQVFYDGLSPYGTWIDYPGYGYAWIPNAGPDFHPYLSGGHWVYTDAGWTWVSDYEWGWATFHYGSWNFDATYGWMWLPGYQWAPAWVTWGSYDGYYGWAPAGFDFSIGIGFPNYRPPINYWCYAPQNAITSININRNIITDKVTINNIHNHVNIINNNSDKTNVYNRGPALAEVEHATGKKITPVKIASAERAGKDQTGNGTVNIYRPKIDATKNGAAKPAKINTPETLHAKAPTNSSEQIDNSKKREVNSSPFAKPATKPQKKKNKEQVTLSSNKTI